MACSFPGADGEAQAITLRVEEITHRSDGHTGHRVRMLFDGALEVVGAAGPITTTADRDVMLRGADGNMTFYTLGLREDGAAALNLMWTRPEDEPARQHTRVGHCENHERYLEEWLTS